MSMSLTALSPLDGRYSEKVSPLCDYFSEYALIRARLTIEIEWFISLATSAAFTAIPSLSAAAITRLRGIIQHFNIQTAEEIKKREAITQHDVKAVEYFLKDVLNNDPELQSHVEWIHFAATSEDINNLSYALLLKEALQRCLLPAFHKLINQLREKSHLYAEVAMLARTHGQSASPTTLGKEFANFTYRLQKQIQHLSECAITGKFNGAVGNYNATVFAFPEIDWQAHTKAWINSLGLTFNPYTTQIEPHDNLVEIFMCLERINLILLDFVRDMWGYISLGYFTLTIKENEVGSSTMPHKVNPIDFENAEGNLGIANALLSHFSNKLPISRFQRDLSDSTVLRNIGVAFGHGYLALTAIFQGLDKCQPSAAISEDLNQHWEILAEPIQTLLRKEGIAAGYEQLKSLTRGQKIAAEDIKQIIAKLPISENAKSQLTSLKPADYVGLAITLAKDI